MGSTNVTDGAGPGQYFLLYTHVVGYRKGLRPILPVYHQWHKAYNTLYKGATDMRNKTEATEASQPYVAA
jgi:hypothetical protein